MSNQICLVVPEAPAIQSAGQATQRRFSLDALRLGTLDNAKSNADHLLQFLVDGLGASFKVKSVLVQRKATSGSGAPAPVLQKLSDEADIVLSAMAD